MEATELFPDINTEPFEPQTLEDAIYAGRKYIGQIEDIGCVRFNSVEEWGYEKHPHFGVHWKDAMKTVNKTGRETGDRLALNLAKCDVTPVGIFEAFCDAIEPLESAYDQLERVYELIQNVKKIRT